MLKKTITYTDYDGETREEDFYFNLRKDEILELNFNANLKLSDQIEGIVKAKDVKEIYSLFKKIILLSYGEKSADGKHFRKSEEISKNFESTEAFSELIMELVTDENKAADFIKMVLPKNLDLPVQELPVE